MKEVSIKTDTWAYKLICAVHGRYRIKRISDTCEFRQALISAIFGSIFTIIFTVAISGAALMMLTEFIIGWINIIVYSPDEMIEWLVFGGEKSVIAAVLITGVLVVFGISALIHYLFNKTADVVTHIDHENPIYVTYKSVKDKVCHKVKFID